MRLFDDLYVLTEETFKILQKPLVAKSVKRKLSSAYDDAEKQKLEAKMKIDELRKNLGDYDVNGILAQQKKIAELEKLQGLLKDEFKLLFDKDMVIDDEE